MEWSGSNRAGLLVWHHLLNIDLPLVPTGGEDSITNLPRSKLVASSRTYAYTGKRFTVDDWQEAVRRGHTFFSTGPVLELHINGQLPGDSVRLPAAGGTLDVEGSVWSFAPLSRVAIYNNGKILKELPHAGAFKEKIPVTHSGWYTLYVEGAHDSRLDTGFPQASTNAIRVYVGDEKIRDTESAQYFVRWIDKLKTMSAAWPGWRSETEKSRVMAQLNEARAVYVRLQ